MGDDYQNKLIFEQVLSMMRSHCLPIIDYSQDPVFLGTGVLFSIGDKKFVITAKHIIKQCNSPKTYFGDDKLVQNIPIIKTLFHSTSDIGCYEVDKNFGFHVSSVLLENISYDIAESSDISYFIIGYPYEGMVVKRKVPIGNIDLCKSIINVTFNSLDDTTWCDGDYSGQAYRFNYSSEDCMFSYSGKFKQGMFPKGMSGGGVYVLYSPKENELITHKIFKLVAIQSAADKKIKKDKKNKEIVAVPIKEAVDLIMKNYPELNMNL